VAHFVVDATYGVAYYLIIKGKGGRKMEARTGKTQQRLLDLLGITRIETYAAAQEALGLAGFKGDAIPFGENWRTVAKMTDAELLNRAKIDCTRGAKADGTDFIQ